MLKVEPQALDQLLHPIFDPKERAKAETAATGLPASPGAATGAIVFTADEAVAWSHKGKRVLLVRMETVPDDIHGMSVAQGILTATGGMTVARGGGGPPDGQALGGGLRRPPHRRARPGPSRSPAAPSTRAT